MLYLHLNTYIFRKLVLIQIENINYKKAKKYNKTKKHCMDPNKTPFQILN